MSWNPLHDLVLLQDRMNRLFEDATQRRSQNWSESDSELDQVDWVPVADIYEADAEYTVAVDLPGIDRDKLEITVDNDRLVIRGDRQAQAPRSGRSERPRGTFLRTFSLPGSIAQNSINADYKDGVLVLHLPKKKQESQKVEIKVS
jgi:HSP20 family protein